jgi:fucose permease
MAGQLLLGATLVGAISALGSAALIRQWGTGRVVLMSTALAGLGLGVTAGATSAEDLWIAAGLLGLGAGAVDACLNGYVARHYAARHMNWLHACWGVGATVGPLVMAGTMAFSMEGWRWGYGVLAGAQMALVICFWSTRREWVEGASSRSRDQEPMEAAGAAEPVTSANSPAGWMSVSIFWVHVGGQVMAGLWIATFLVMARGASPAEAGLGATVYYGSITAGRFLNGILVERWGNRRVVTRLLWLGLTGAVGLWLAEPGWAVGVALLLLGAGTSAVYPCLMHEVPRRFRSEDVQTMIGRQNAAAYLGAALLPFGVGSLIQVAHVDVVPGLVLTTVLLQIASVWWLDKMT